jgi:predicted MPP superfamily phosphohydrolase
MLKSDIMTKIVKILKLLLFPLGILAVLLFLGLVAWFLSSHGAIGLIRVNSLFLYVFLFVIAVGVVFAGLFLWYWQIHRKGREKNGLFGFLFVASLLLIALFSFCLIQLSGFPQSKDIKPLTQLAIPDTAGQNLHFAVGSDAHFGAGTNSPGKTANMLDQIGNPANKYDTFFFLGDLVEYGFKDKQWEEAFKAFSAANNVPVRLVPGNHDTLLGGFNRYLAFTATPFTQSPDRLWQRIDAGNIHFLLLDIEWSAETFSKDQADWLETQLKSIPDGDWKIVMSHGFYYASGIYIYGWNWYDNPETISALTPLFEKYGVDLVFSGHDHIQELLQHAGVTYVITGAFGGNPDPASTYISPASLWQLAGGTGFMDVTVTGNEAALIFRNYDGSVNHTFTLVKK